MAYENETWVKGQRSPYQLHDLVHFPDWRNIIVLDFFFNNLTSGLCITACTLFLCSTVLFGDMLFYALTLAFIIVVFDLLLLIADLGDHYRFIHAMRVLHVTSPLAVGVVGLIFYSITLFLALVFFWLIFISDHTNGFLGGAVPVLDTLKWLFTILAFIGACVVICYKGVVFSCTSQPGVKDARWLTAWSVSDAMLIGLDVYVLMTFALSNTMATVHAAIPMIVLIVTHLIGFSLMLANVHKRSGMVYRAGVNALDAIVVYGICGIGSIVAVFFGGIGMAIAAILGLFCGIWERYWLIGLAKHL